MTTQITNLIKGMPDWSDDINSNFETVANAIDENAVKIGVLTTSVESVNATLSEIKNKNAVNPLYIKTYDGQNQCNHPKVLYFPDKFNGWKYWMAYTPYPNSNDDYENPCITVSNNGLDWVTPIGLVNPLVAPTTEQLANGSHFSDPHLVYREDTKKLECWYRFNGGNKDEYIYRRTTTDGVNWTEQETCIENLNYANITYYSPTVLFENNKYRMYYVNSFYDVAYRESYDAVTWENEVVCPCELGGRRAWHLDIIHTDLGYEMVITAFYKADFTNNVQKLFYSLSTDGINFSNGKIILEASMETGWDNQQVYRTSIVKKGNKYYLYYSAMNSDLKWHIGLTCGTDIEHLVGYNDVENRDFFKTLVNSLSIDNKATLLANNGLLEFKNGESYINIKALGAILDNITPLGDRVTINGIAEVISSEVARLSVTQSGVGSSYIYSNRIVTGLIELYASGLAKFNNGNNAAYISASTNYADTIQIIRAATGKNGFLENSGIIITGDNICPEVEGAIRYNKSTKKHQGYNGVIWNDLY